MNGSELRTIRQRLSLTQEAMGRLLFRHKNIVARYERDELPIPPIVAKLAELLKSSGSKKKSS